MDFGAIETSAKATSSVLGGLKTEVPDDGLSLLLLRPQLLLTTLHNLVILLASNLAGSNAPSPLTQITLQQSFDSVFEGLSNDVAVSGELMEKIRGMESKLEYQIKKLMALADAAEIKGEAVVDAVEEDPLSFRPNIAALQTNETSEKSSGESRGAYRPPRLAAVPYKEPGAKRKERRAPALLSEFAATMDGAPLMESTSGLSTRPVQAGQHTNSISGKRAAELKRMNEFEEENMTRLVTTKREAKRRREDEEALSLGYGVGGPSRGRNRRQNGLEAELEGVLGDRRSKSVWDGVAALGKREGLLDRGRKKSKH